MTQIIETLPQLREQISGTVLLPSDPEYDTTRRGWNLSVDQHPALILLANDVQDVVAGVRYADAHNLGVAVQLTGHGAKFPADGELMIVTSRMNGVSVDAQARSARVEAGVIWQQVIDLATPHGLAPLLGTSPHIGVVGYTLGGGIGWLSRQYGLAADSVLSIDLVTPDGELRHTSPTENNDLFWALLGGGGNFGVVTAIEFILYPVATLYGGFITYPSTMARDTLRFYREWIKSVPDQLTSSIALFKYPDVPQLPDAIRGKQLVMMRAAYNGDAAAGEQLMRAWLEWQTPESNTFAMMPFAEIAKINNDPVAPTPAHPHSDMLTELSDGVIDLLVRYATDGKSPVVYSEIRHMGGATARTDGNTNAVGNRDVPFYLQLGGIAFNPDVRKALVNYVREYTEALQPYLHGGIYLNFADGNQASSRIKDAYSPQSYARLLAIKAQVDPKNMFRYSYPLVTTA